MVKISVFSKKFKKRYFIIIGVDYELWKKHKRVPKYFEGVGETLCPCIK